ncbi:MAG: YncE family protein, partial [Anaerolineae bacterium]
MNSKGFTMILTLGILGFVLVALAWLAISPQVIQATGVSVETTRRDRATDQKIDSRNEGDVSQNTDVRDNGALAYVTLNYTDSVALVDTATHAIIGTVDVGASGCDFPWRATMSPDGAYVYVGCFYSGSVAVIETDGNTVVANLDGIPSADGIAFTRDGAYALVGSRHSSQIAIVDTVTYSKLFLSTAAAPRSIAAHPWRDRAYATCADGTILVIDTTTFGIVNTIPVGADPWDVAVSPDGQWVFTGDRQGAGLAIIDASNEAVHTTITGLGDLTGLDVAPDSSRVYACSLDGNVQVVDTSRFASLASVSVSGSPWEAAITCDGAELYVGNNSDQVPVLDTDSLTVNYEMLMPSGNSRGIAICPQPTATGVFLVPRDQTNAGAHGNMVNHQEQLFNLTGSTDSFTLTLGSYAWDTGLSAYSVGPLANGDSLSFTVYSTVPTGADWYSTDTVLVTATSVASPTVYSNTASFTTQAYAPPEISVVPELLTSIQYVNETTTEELVLSNGDGVTLTFDTWAGSGPGVSLFAASTELYGYAVPQAWLRVIGAEDDTYVQVVDLDSGTSIAENTDLDRYELWDIYPGTGTHYKV